MNRKSPRLGMLTGWVLGVSMTLLMGFTFSTPGFQSGETISSSAMNDKLQELAAAITALENATFGASGAGGLDDRVQAVETLLTDVTRTGSDIFFDGVNLHVRNGSGSTMGTPNGVGNVIIGYNEMRTDDADPETDDSNFRTGSHYLIVGQENNYSRFGGIVASRRNTSEGDFACVTGGHSNIAGGSRASITGGQHGRASGIVSSIGGGFKAQATGTLSTVSGGNTVTAAGFIQHAP